MSDLEKWLNDGSELVGRAQAEVDSICLGSRKWTMSIPARPDTDSDCVIYAGLRHSVRQAAIIRVMREALDGIDAMPFGKYGRSNSWVAVNAPALARNALAEANRIAGDADGK